MKPRDLAELLLLAAIWGASFLFLRIASPLVGPLAVAAARVGGGALILLPLLLWRRELRGLRPFLPALMLSALLSYVLPFIGIGQAARALPAGLLSILNATTPLWGALVGWWWVGERLSPARLGGLLMGVAGVALLTADQQLLGTAVAHTAVLLMLGSTLMYAIAVHQTRRQLSSLSPLAITTSSMSLATCLLVLPAWWWGPQPLAMPSATPLATGLPATWAAVPAIAWWAMAGLALLCTALAYLLFFRLIARVGPTRALTVTFLIPVFGMLWGALFLKEQITPFMLAGAGVIVLGTLLSNRAAPAARPSPNPHAASRAIEP
ncbi:MAG: DMT family transporter [Rubrivivax sp.]|nr:MAG: DMT family transporter [Rubrivivax sp.]